MREFVKAVAYDTDTHECDAFVPRAHTVDDQ
jgi:hypothetical protein